MSSLIDHKELLFCEMVNKWNAKNAKNAKNAYCTRSEQGVLHPSELFQKWIAELGFFWGNTRIEVTNFLGTSFETTSSTVLVLYQQNVYQQVSIKHH